MTKKRILLIEDDDLIRESTSIFLEEEGYDVFKARNGLEGIRVALETLPNLILCDIAMPRVNGYEVLLFLKDHPQGSSIPFIFLTAKTEKDDIKRGYDMGIKHYITKPFDFKELLEAITDIIK